MHDDLLEFHLLNDYQHEFPLVSRPFQTIAGTLGVAEDKVLMTLRRLSADGKVSRVGAVFRPHQVGASTLAAIAAPPDRLEQVAALVSEYPEVNHNYARDHRYNLWFVVTAATQERVQSVLGDIESRINRAVLFLPMLEDFHIDLGFDLTGRPAHKHDRFAAADAHHVMSATDYRIVTAIQGGLPITSRPFTQTARQVGIGEDELLSRLRQMTTGGIIKRFGVIVRHHELGYRSNAMTVWDIAENAVSTIGRKIADYDFVTLCYRRQRHNPLWGYNLYCMIHGRDRDTVMEHVEQLRSECGLQAYPHEVLFSTRRFKQCGAHYGTASATESLRSA